MLLIKDLSAWTLKSVGMKLNVTIALTQICSRRFYYICLHFHILYIFFQIHGENLFHNRSFSSYWLTVAAVTIYQ